MKHIKMMTNCNYPNAMVHTRKFKKSLNYWIISVYWATPIDVKKKQKLAFCILHIYCDGYTSLHSSELKIEAVKSKAFISKHYTWSPQRT